MERDSKGVPMGKINKEELPDFPGELPEEFITALEKEGFFLLHEKDLLIEERRINEGSIFL